MPFRLFPTRKSKELDDFSLDNVGDASYTNDGPYNQTLVQELDVVEDRIDGKLLQLSDMLEKSLMVHLTEEQSKNISVLFESTAHGGVDCVIEIHLSGGVWSNNDIENIRNKAFELLWEFFLHREDIVFLFNGIYQVKE